MSLSSLSGKIISIALLLLPPWAAVQCAILFADLLSTPMVGTLKPFLAAVSGWPAPLNHMLGLDYGVVSMFPFLALYAFPTVLLFAVVLSLYRTSGLIERLAVSVQRLVSPLGLDGRDVVRVVMGFGCNVPAVISARQSPPHTRGNCIKAISFGSACSYQLPATVAIFAAAQMSYLIIPYLVVLALTTLTYLWVTSSKTPIKLNSRLSFSEGRRLQWPSWCSVASEIVSLVREFLTVALPLFMAICLIAGALDWLGFIQSAAWALEPVMALFNLPAEAATSVVLGSIRKDGIAIGLLSSSWDALKIPINSPVQLLTLVYLAGCLLPCIVTALTVAREMGARFAVALLLRQMTAVVIFSFVVAWGGRYLL